MTKKIFLYSVFACCVIGAIFFFVYASIATKKSSAVSETSVTPPAPPFQVKPFVILIVPGHDTNTGGASYKNLYERDLVVDVANDISVIMSKDPDYKIIIARDKQVWTPVLANYFLNDKQAILDFKNQHQIADKIRIASGQEKVIPDAAIHSTADTKTAIELYGINKWADENDVDLVIHLHFNSSQRKNPNLPGSYHGFDMFIPDAQRANYAASRVIAEDIYTQLQKKFEPETLGSTFNSLYEDQSLIALGASNTLTKPAVLIEYAYIYEKMLQASTSRAQALEQMAKQTVVGIMNYAGSTKPIEVN